jgi:cytochrome c peroxidase
MRWASRNRVFTLLLGSVLAGAMQLPESALAETKRIEMPADARLHGLESLRLAIRQDGGVPLPEKLADFIKDRKAAVQLGKALFWDTQVGSDGVQACASCHFHAGADDRSKNALNPGQDMVVDQRDGDVIGYFNAGASSAAPHFETGSLTRP